MKNIYIKKRDIMISMIIKLTCNDKNLEQPPLKNNNSMLATI
jgi:hypothetical protein